MKAQLISSLTLINEALAKAEAKSLPIGLHCGISGLALYYAYYASYSGEVQYLERSKDLIIDGFESLESGFQDCSICNGLAGLTWTYSHLVNEELIIVENSDFLEEIDSFFGSQMLEDVRKKRYDYLHNALGLGLHHLERLPNPTAKKYLINLVEVLETITVEDKGYKVWEDYFSDATKVNGYNLGLAHGIPSIATFLSLLKKNGVSHTDHDNLLCNTIHWILKQELGKEEVSCFSNYRNNGIDKSLSSRLGWCYGDPGIASSIWLAGDATGNNFWKAEAVRIMLKAAQRDLTNSGVSDYSFCHGSAGLIHMFNRFFNRTGRAEFLAAAEYWSKCLILDLENRLGPKKWQNSTRYKTPLEIDYTLINGLSGIGLVLISAITNEDPAWDRCFLLS